MKESIIGACCLTLAASIWGSMYVISKYILMYVPPITLLWFRYVIACLLLFAVMAASRKGKKMKLLSKRDGLLFMWIGFIGYFISIAFQFIGTKLSDAHTGALITSSTPAFIVIFAWFVLKERITARKLLSLIVATIGVVICIGGSPRVGTYALGNIILVGAAVTWALLSVYVKKASRKFSSLMITTYSMIFALLFSTPFMIVEQMNEPMTINQTPIILGILYLGTVSTAGAFFLWNKGLELMDAGIGSLFLFLQPIVGAILGWLWLKETLSYSFYIGGCFILVGIIIATRRKEQSAKKRPNTNNKLTS
ncbi:EamA family transporter [Terrilactibacillus sp. BCM23-1]|uniref:EamA family transporter n=1 Tax=Terrilactibacillus tamarindi TaxID=2599694 RepID=A0A6N8CSI3_9BACI|nr:EamA family transporter [Terrilactibacillus tamarindi]MTT30946.1 EamA family transporter [Terrilactibacillus tamarindi]